MRKRTYALSILSALLYVAASPPIDIEPLGYVCLVPLLFALDRDASSRNSFKTGFVGGLASSFGLYYWLVYTMTTYGGLTYLLGFLVFLLLAIYLSSYWAVFSCLVKYAASFNMPRMVAVPFLWVSLEYIRSFLLTGFPWAFLGYTQYKSEYLIQISDLTGVYGVSFILALSSVIIYEGMKKIVSTRLFPFKEASLFAALIAVVFIYGIVKIQTFKEPAKVVNAALIQGNIDQDRKWDRDFQDETINIYSALSRKAYSVKEDLDLIIWPETATPFYFQIESKLNNDVKEISRSLGVSLFFGSPAFKRTDDHIGYLNSAFLISPSANGDKIEIAGRYDKYHLVPFGEYVPFKNLLFFVNKITEGIGDFSPGKGVVTLDFAINEKNEASPISLGPLICYEGIFPDLVRRFVKKGANVLVNITNDAWYGRSSAPYQHLSAVVFRAVENGVYLLRAANTGITAVIDPLGRIEKKTDLFTPAYLTAKVGIYNGGNLYTHIGDVFSIVILSASTLMIIYSYIKGR